MSALITGWSNTKSPQSEKQAGTFTSYEQRAAEEGGEVRYGLDKELAQKAAAKYDDALEASCRAWVQSVAGVSFGAGSSLQEELKSGVVLCQLANAIKPGSEAGEARVPCGAPKRPDVPCPDSRAGGVRGGGPNRSWPC